MNAVFNSTRAELFALAKHGKALSHIEIEHAEFERVVGPIESATGIRHKRDCLEFMVNGVLVKCPSPSRNNPTPQ